jgi:hypothetical protein
MSVTWADLSSLSACSQLSSLELNSCQVQAAGPDSITSPLSAVRSLTQLSVIDAPTSIAASLTQLTGLSVVSDRETVGECLGHIKRLTQLQKLELDSTDCEITAGQVVSILTSLKQLTSLALYYLIHQKAFDALLTHAPQLTSFTCDALFLKQGRSACPCSWKELIVGSFQDAHTLAWLPTDSLTRLGLRI